MAQPQAAALPLAHPLAGDWLRFNFLPSLLLHPSRAGDWAALAGQAQPPASLHRHWSAALARSAGLEPVAGLDAPGLALAMLPAAGFAQLLRWCGLVLCAPAIRRVIERAPLAALRAQIGEQALAFARAGAAAVHPGLAPARGWAPAQAAAECDRQGGGLLYNALQQAPAPVARRGQLRLAADAQ
ncbi:MAG TPA: SctK family type III secretion system sorting platform protein, partial [Ramlibacter sp.]|nr:SctK family type III secretion system sorting platform protein [Ramlibacter sp.]